MRHFHSLGDVAEALAFEAEKDGHEVQRRDGGLYLVVKSDCECGAHAVEEVNLTAIAVVIWEASS